MIMLDFMAWIQKPFDYLYTYKTVDSLHFANFMMGCLNMIPYGNLVGAMATHWEGNEDSTIWRFDLRQGVYWYTDEGEEYAEVTAQDFVTGLQHAADFSIADALSRSIGH